jgi:hypothetical protein
MDPYQNAYSLLDQHRYKYLLRTLAIHWQSKTNNMNIVWSRKIIENI